MPYSSKEKQKNREQEPETIFANALISKSYNSEDLFVELKINMKRKKRKIWPNTINVEYFPCKFCFLLSRSTAFQLIKIIFWVKSEISIDENFTEGDLRLLNDGTNLSKWWY